MSRTSSSLLSISLLFGLLGSLSAQAEKTAPTGQVPVMATAKIVAIKGNSVTIQNDSGARRTLDLVRTKGLQVGLPTSWCEEDCLVLNVWAEYPVRRVNPH